MIADRLAEIHARAMTVPAPWTSDDFKELLCGKGVFLVSSTLPKYAGESARGAAPLSLTATPKAAQNLVGFALGRVILDEAELLTLAIDPACQRKGLGSECLAAFEAEAARRGAVHLHLEVADANSPARALYRSAGWRDTGRRKGYYRTPDARIDAILMSKPLGSD